LDGGHGSVFMAELGSKPISMAKDQMILEKWLVFIDALRVAAIVFVIITTPRKPTSPLVVFGLCTIARKGDWFTPFYIANAAFGLCNG
jgi:hypothetical protein